MRAVLILAGSVLVVLAGCVQWSSQRPGGTASLPGTGAAPALLHPTPLRAVPGTRPAVAPGGDLDAGAKDASAVELGEPSSAGLDDPHTVPAASESAPDEASTADEPLFEGPALPGRELDIQLGAPSESPRSFKPAPQASPKATGPAEPIRPALPWTPSFYSTQRRAVQGLRAGNGRAPSGSSTLVVGSLHGDEPLAVALVERLAEYAGVCPDSLSDRRVVFLRSPNPDGLAAGTRTNSRGIDLNRNFPTFNFRADRRLRTGPSRGSEVETRGLLRLLYAVRPERVVHVKTTTDPIGWVLYNRRAIAAVQQFSGMSDLRLRLLTHNAIAGSLESYVADVLGLEMITVAVPAGSDAEGLWNEYADVLLTAIGATGGASSLSGGGTRPRTAAPRGYPASSGTHRGKTLSSESEPGQAATGGPIPAKGYFELPPPPEETLTK